VTVGSGSRETVSDSRTDGTVGRGVPVGLDEGTDRGDVEAEEVGGLDVVGPGFGDLEGDVLEVGSALGVAEVGEVGEVGAPVGGGVRDGSSGDHGTHDAPVAEAIPSEARTTSTAAPTAITGVRPRQRAPP